MRDKGEEDMKTLFILFAARRYWTEDADLQRAFEEIKENWQGEQNRFLLSVDGSGLADVTLAADEIPVLIPLSGAIQPYVLQAARQFASHSPLGILLYAAYVQGNVSAWAEEQMLLRNAAPTIMDTWSVLRQEIDAMELVLSREDLARRLEILGAYLKIRRSKLLLIGETEPWVVSASRVMGEYEALGPEIVRAPQSEVRELYERVTVEEADSFCQKYKNNAECIVEPTDEDIRNAGRMVCALLKMLEKYEADGMAIACFNLLSTGTTACLGVSYINDCTDKVAACEGDLDSALSMLIMKCFTKTKVWMANPGLHPGGVVNFSHCTAPICVDGVEERPFVVRSHHESGIGASLQVDMPLDRKVTAFRISAANGKATVQTGISVPGDHESCCHTQMYVRFEDFDGYLQTALGCHQVFCYEDIADRLVDLSRMLGLEVWQPESKKG